MTSGHDQDADEFRKFLEKLKRDEHRSEALNSIKNLLIYKAGETSSSSNTIMDVGLSTIFKCLSIEDNPVQVDLTCEVLKLCFDKFNVGEIVQNYTGYVMYLLRHEKACVRQLAIGEVYKTVTSDPQLLPVEKYVDVFVAVGQLVVDSDTAISNKAIMITSNLPCEAYPRVLEEMKIALQHDSSSKCNAYEVIINISTKSTELFQLCVEQGYIDYMLSELQSSDVLYKMNILELLSRLAVTSHGVKHLVECGAMEKISQFITESETNPLRNILIPGYMKFFGCIAHLYPREIFEKYPALLDFTYKAFDSQDQTTIIVALDTLGFIGYSIEGKLTLAASGNKYTSAVAKVGEFIKNGTTEVKVRALRCFASLIGYNDDSNAPKSSTIDHRVILMTREWFRSLGTKPESMEILQGLCKNPFPDIKLAAYSLLDAACLHRWAEELVAKTPGFVEYLLDRTVDYTKESKEAKYEVVKKLYQSTAFDSNTIMRLTKYVEEGPFFSESLLQVAMEEGD